MRTLFLSKTVFLFFMAFLAGASLYAQNDTLRVQTLEEVVISGSRQEERILDARGPSLLSTGRRLKTQSITP